MTASKAEQLTSVVLAVFRLNGQLIEWGNAFCQPHGLTSARWQVLGAIALAPRAQSAPQIAASMGVTRQGAQKQLNLLLDEGLVLAQANPAHRRSPLYALSERGHVVFQAVDQRWRAHAEALSGQFGADALDQTLAMLSSLLQAHAGPPDET